MEDNKNNMTSAASKTAFYAVIISALALIASLILYLVGITGAIFEWIQIGSWFLMFIALFVCGWQYCKNRMFVVQLLYFIFAAAVVVSVILPRVM